MYGFTGHEGKSALNSPTPGSNAENTPESEEERGDLIEFYNKVCKKRIYVYRGDCGEVSRRLLSALSGKFIFRHDFFEWSFFVCACVPPLTLLDPPFKMSGSSSDIFLFVCLFVCLLACLFVCVFACLFVCLIACLIACLFVGLFVCLLACLFDCLFVCWLVCLCVCLLVCLVVCLLFVFLLACLLACLFVVCLFVYLFVCLFVCLFV